MDNRYQPRCPECRKPLMYVGDIGAPGFGQAYECPECGESYVWLRGLRVLSTRAPELTEADVV